MKETKWAGYRSIIGVSILAFCHTGIIRTLAIFIPEFVAAGIPLAKVSLIATIATATSTIVSLVLGSVIRKVPGKTMYFIGSTLMLAMMACYMLAESAFVLWIGGFFAGILIGAASTALASICVGDWFIEKRSEMLGIVLGIQALGGALMTFVAGQLNNMFSSYKTTYLVMIILLGVICYGANIIFVRDPKKLGQKPLGWENAQASAGSAKQELPGVTYQEALKSPSLWLILLLGVLISIAVSSSSTYGPTFFQSKGISKVTSSNYLTIYYIISAGAATLSGKINAKFGEKVTVTVLCGFMAVGLFLFYLWPSLGCGSGLLLLFCCVAACGVPAFNSMVPMIATGCFGPKESKRITPILQCSLYAGGAVASPLIVGISAAFGDDMTKVYLVTAIMAAVCLVLGVAACAIAPYKKAK